MTDASMKPTSRQICDRPVAIIVTLVIAWFGLWIHELHRVPAAFGLTPDASLPLLVIAGVLLAWRLLARRKRAATIALLVYGIINCVGGFLSVLPLPFLLFVPEQEFDHYLVHAIYALFQVPLIIVTIRALAAKATQSR